MAAKDLHQLTSIKDGIPKTLATDYILNPVSSL